MQDVATSEALQKFFEKSSKDCTCHWPNPFFGSALSEYVKLRMEVHRVRKRGDRISYALGNAITTARRRLETLAPCRDCIAKFNPTGRTNGKVWNPQRARAYKEALM